MFVEADGEFWTASLPPSPAPAPKKNKRQEHVPSSSGGSSGGAGTAPSSISKGGLKKGAVRSDNTDLNSGGDGDGGGDGGADNNGKEAAATGRGIPFSEVNAAFNRGGFSVVINRLQRRWRALSEISLALEDVLGHPVNANLYMTPPNSQGFEAHFDWMDGRWVAG